jgi:hypothetical protein
MNTMNTSNTSNTYSNKNSMLCNSVIQNFKCSRKDCNYAHDLEELNIQKCHFGNTCKNIIFNNGKYTNVARVPFMIKPIKKCIRIHNDETLDNYYDRMGYFPRKVYSHKVDKVVVSKEVSSESKEELRPIVVEDKTVSIVPPLHPNVPMTSPIIPHPNPHIVPIITPIESKSIIPLKIGITTNGPVKNKEKYLPKKISKKEEKEAKKLQKKEAREAKKLLKMQEREKRQKEREMAPIEVPPELTLDTIKMLLESGRKLKIQLCMQ